MRTVLLLTIASLACAADAPPAMPPDAFTAQDLQNLCVCARRALPQMTTDEMAAVVVALRHAEVQVRAMQAAEAKVAIAHSTTAAAVKP